MSKSKECFCAVKHEGECYDITLKEENCSDISGLRAYTEFEHNVKECLGELLTIVDATYGEERQNKAMKDVVKKTFYRMLSKSQQYCSDMDSKNGASWGNSIHLEDSK